MIMIEKEESGVYFTLIGDSFTTVHCEMDNYGELYEMKEF